MKKTISLMLTLLLLFSLGSAAFAANGGIDSLKINPYGGDESAIDTIAWYASGGRYFLFLPADTDLPAAKVYFTAADEVTLDGEAIVSGGNNGGSSGVSFWQLILDWVRQIFSVIAGRFKR